MRKLFLLFFLVAAIAINISCAPEYWRHNVFNVVIFPKGPNISGVGKSICQGMTKKEVLSLVGEPDRKSVFKSENKEIWVYTTLIVAGNEAVLTFNNDVLKNIDEYRLEKFSKKE
jgi:hypothetical protein